MTSPMAEVTENVRDRNRLSGSMGSVAADSMRTNAVSDTAATPNPASTSPSAKPRWPASIMATASATRAAIAVSCPGRSMPRPAARGVSVANRRVSRMPASPIGALMKKIDRQPSDEVSTPPMSGPQGHRGTGRPQADRVRAGPLVAVGVVEQAQRGRHQHGGPGPLDRPRGDQEAQRRSQPAGGRGHREQREPGDEHPLGPDPVAQGPGRQDQRGEGDRVGADDPLQPADPAAEVRADRLDGHVDHAHVQLDDPEAQAGGQQGPPRTPAVGCLAGLVGWSPRAKPVGRHDSRLGTSYFDHDRIKPSSSGRPCRPAPVRRQRCLMMRKARPRGPG